MYVYTCGSSRLWLFDGINFSLPLFDSLNSAVILLPRLGRQWSLHIKPILITDNDVLGPL